MRFHLGNPICLFFHVKFSLMVNLCLPLDRPALLVFADSSSIYSQVGPASETHSICTVVLPLGLSIEVSPHVTSLRAGCGLHSNLLHWKACFSNIHLAKLWKKERYEAVFLWRLTFILLRKFCGRNSSMAFSSSNVLTIGPSRHQGQWICAFALTCHGLSTFPVPQVVTLFSGCDAFYRTPNVITL